MTYAPSRPRTTHRRPSSLMAAAIAGLIAWVGRALTLWNNRRAVFRLAQFDARGLNDIGLSPADVQWALSLPWHVDPSLALSERVAQKRAAARWARRFPIRSDGPE